MSLKESFDAFVAEFPNETQKLVIRNCLMVGAVSAIASIRLKQRQDFAGPLGEKMKKVRDGGHDLASAVISWIESPDWIDAVDAEIDELVASMKTTSG